MKKGFTLIELLVVTLVIAILASIVFRLKGTVSNLDKKQETVARMLKLENCISGYYAAFGSYPPVVLHGSRNPFAQVDGYGVQDLSKPLSTQLSLDQIEAACRAQPVIMNFPFNRKDSRKMVKEFSGQIQELRREDPDYRAAFDRYPWVRNGFDGLQSSGQLASRKGKLNWGELQMYRFGLMSYLLPRYLAMMGHSDNEMYDGFAQWRSHNALPSRFESGAQYEDWGAVNDDLKPDDDENDQTDKVNENRWKIELLPSQAVTRRWMQNLEGLCKTPIMNKNTVFFGVNIVSVFQVFSPQHPDSFGGWVYSSDGNESQLYMLNGVTVQDGWNKDLYYYSPPPYQSYRLWSAGQNGLTFPPWYPPEQLKGISQQKVGDLTIEQMIADDIVHLSAMRSGSGVNVQLSDQKE